MLRPTTNERCNATRRRFLSSAGAAIVSLIPSTLVEILKPPAGANSEQGATITSLKGGVVRWRNEWTMERSTLNGRRIIRFTERGNGRYSPFEREVRWNVETAWTAEESFLPLQTERVVTDAAGRRLMRERKSFNFDGGAVEIDREDGPSGPQSRRSIKIPPDTLAVDGIAGALRALPFERPRPFQAHLLSNEPRLYEVSVEARGRERVRTPAGEFECYKVELVPGLGVLNLFRFAIPKAYFWFSVDPTHFWVRYEGLENGRGTPEVVMELARFER